MDGNYDRKQVVMDPKSNPRTPSDHSVLVPHQGSQGEVINGISRGVVPSMGDSYASPENSPYDVASVARYKFVETEYRLILPSASGLSRGLKMPG